MAASGCLPPDRWRNSFSAGRLGRPGRCEQGSCFSSAPCSRHGNYDDRLPCQTEKRDGTPVLLAQRDPPVLRLTVADQRDQQDGWSRIPAVEAARRRKPSLDEWLAGRELPPYVTDEEVEPSPRIAGQEVDIGHACLPCRMDDQTLVAAIGANSNFRLAWPSSPAPHLCGHIHRLQRVTPDVTGLNTGHGALRQGWQSVGRRRWDASAEIP